MPLRPPCRRRPSPPPRPASPARRRGRRPVPGKTNGKRHAVRRRGRGMRPSASARPHGGAAVPARSGSAAMAAFDASAPPHGRTAVPAGAAGRVTRRPRRSTRRGGWRGPSPRRTRTPVRNHCVGGPERKRLAPCPNSRFSPTSVGLNPGQRTSGSPPKPSNCGTWDSPTPRSPAASAFAPAPSSRPSSGSGTPRDVSGGRGRPPRRAVPCALRPPGWRADVGAAGPVSGSPVR